MIISLLKELETENIIEEDKYQYNGVNVPRVNTILSSMLHEESLMNWSNYLGLCKRTRYSSYMETAANVGTDAHNFIEEYIKTNKSYFEGKDNLNRDMQKVKHCVESFILWYNKIRENNQIEIIGMENALVCPWFGGTYDLLIKINGQVYLTDFKTSNHVGYRYFLQLSAYRYMLENYYNIHINGTIILQVDKFEDAFEEYTLTFNDSNHLNFINDCEQCFLSLVYAYYNRLKVENEFDIIFKG